MLQELRDPGLLQVFVKQVVVAALDRKDRERELASQLLAHLHPKVHGKQYVYKYVYTFI